MRDVRERALLVDEVDAALGGEARRDRSIQVEADELAIGSADLFSDDDLKARVHLPNTKPALDRVVIGDADRAELRLTGELGEFGATVAGVFGVHVHVQAQAVHPASVRQFACRPPRSGSAAGAVGFSECEEVHDPLDIRGECVTEIGITERQGR
jgi:hypothetical protein